MLITLLTVAVIDIGREFAVRNVHFGPSGELGPIVIKAVELDEKLEQDCVIRMVIPWVAKAIAPKLKLAIYNHVVSYLICFHL